MTLITLMARIKNDQTQSVECDISVICVKFRHSKAKALHRSGGLCESESNPVSRRL
jgi:hypothetical protein